MSAIPNGKELQQSNKQLNLNLKLDGFWYTKQFPKNDPVIISNLAGEDELKKGTNDLRIQIQIMESKLKGLWILKSIHLIN